MAKLKRQVASQVPSRRERELVRLICSGHSTQEAATIMGVSVKTAEAHRKNAMGKLGVDNAVKLTHWAIGNGLVEIEAASNSANELSAREREVARLICTGLSTKEAAWLMGIATCTAETHRNHIMRKLRLNNAVKLTRWAIATGLVKVMNFGAAPRTAEPATKQNVA